MTRTRVKFCGMTRAEDVDLACSLGVHALGFIFVSSSPRALEIGGACDLVARVPLLVTRIGLFSDATGDEVRAVLARVALDALQFHGGESAQFCEQFAMPYVKAVAMGSAGDIDVAAMIDAHPNARGFVFDAHRRGGSGGAGVTFDWSRIPADVPRAQTILAGGLDPDNVADAVARVRPGVVDVASGIEAAPGRKDAARMRQFMREVERADERTQQH